MTYLCLFGAIILLVIQANAIHILVSDSGDLYYIETENYMSWNNADLFCKLRNMSLVAIGTRDKHDELKKMLNYYFDSESLSSMFLWTSANYEGNELMPTVEFAKAHEKVFTNWDKNTISVGNCIKIGGSDLLWYDEICYKLSGYICEGKLITGDANWDEVNELKKSHSEALKIAVDEKLQELDDLKNSLETLRTDKNNELDILKKSHQDELTTQRNSCGYKALSYIKKQFQESRPQMNQDRDELKNINETTNIL